MATKKAMEDKAAQLQADLNKLNAEIGTMKDDEAGLKKDDWALWRYRSDRNLFRVTDIGANGSVGHAGGNCGIENCTRIPFDVAKLVESMMALPCPDGYEWTGEVGVVDRSRKSSDFVLTGEGDVRNGASVEGRVRTNNCPRPILRKKA